MKKVVILSLAVIMVLLFTAAVQAAENNWRIQIKADDNNGMYISSTQMGIYPTSVDGYDAQDTAAAFLADPEGKQYANWVCIPIPGRTEAFMKSIKAPFATNNPYPTKTWDLRVFALKDAANTAIRLKFLAVNTSTTILPPSSFNGVPVNYYLKMVDNKGVAGAPANGTVWNLPIPTIADTINPFFELVMPTGLGTDHSIILQQPYETTYLTGAYVMEYGFAPQGVIPEPSSMLALGSGLSGLLGFFIRRRRG